MQSHAKEGYRFRLPGTSLTGNVHAHSNNMSYVSCKTTGHIKTLRLAVNIKYILSGTY
jgi:hypothetical protein